MIEIDKDRLVLIRQDWEYTHGTVREMIVRACTDIPWLLDQLEEAQARIVELETQKNNDACIAATESIANEGPIVAALRAWLDTRHFSGPGVLAKIDELQGQHAEQARAERVAEARRVLEGDVPRRRTPELWDGHAAERIVSILLHS